jgi:hypothetical protein
MSTSQLLDRTFHLYRNNFLLFAGIAALPPGMLLVVQFIALVLGRFAGQLLERAGIAVVLVAVLSGVVFLVVYLLGSALATGATVYAVSCAHLGNPVTIVESYRAVSSLTLRIIGIILLISVMAGVVLVAAYAVFLVPLFLLRGGNAPVGGIVSCCLGFPLLIAGFVLAFYVYCRFSLAVPACVVESIGVIASLQRSSFLSKKALWRILLIYLLAGILAAAIGFALSIPNYIALGLHNPPTLPFQIWGFVAGFLAKTIAGPIGAIAIALVYYDQRVRKEAFDLQLMMQAMGEPAAPPPIMPPLPPPPDTPPTAPPAIGP